MAHLRTQVLKAADDKLDGTIAIHWRTEEVLANLHAFAQFAKDPKNAPATAAFYEEYCRPRYGPVAGKVAAFLSQMDSQSGVKAAALHSARLDNLMTADQTDCRTPLWSASPTATL